MIDIVKNASILESVAKNYAESSDEYAAIKLAANALHFAWQEEVQERFRKYLEEKDSPLTDAELSHFKNLGINIE